MSNRSLWLARNWASVGRNAGEAVDLLASEGSRVFDRRADAVLEFADARRMARNAPFALGPIALDVSLLSLLGVLVAYLIARSLF